MTIEEKVTLKAIERALYDGNLGEDLTGIPEDLVVEEVEW